MEFRERTIKIVIDQSLCRTCETKACLEACSTYARGILVRVDGLPDVVLLADELQRRGTECLACEEACRLEGKSALKIEATIPGLEDYRFAQGTTF